MHTYTQGSTLLEGGRLWGLGLVINAFTGLQ